MAAKKGKRTADTYLTDQNWDNEDKKSDEEEEVICFLLLDMFSTFNLPMLYL